MSGTITVISGANGGFTGAALGVLQLGPVVFSEALLEVPQSLGSLGGHQVIATHDFPGGVRTQQTFGAFPDVIEWSGYFTGTNAWDRVAQVDLIRAAGKEVQLIYGSNAFLGLVSVFTPKPGHQWLVPYTIRFEPRVDISQGVPQQPQPTPEEQLNTQTTALSSLLYGGGPSP